MAKVDELDGEHRLKARGAAPRPRLAAASRSSKPLAPDESDDARPTTSNTRRRASRTRRKQHRGGQRHVRQQRATCRRSATSRAPSSCRTTTARSTTWRPRNRMPDLDDKVARAQRNYISNDGDWIDFEATVSTAEDQIAIAPGLPPEGVGRERAALLPLQDGRADPEFLRVPLGALRGEEGRVDWRRQAGADRDLLPAGPRVRPGRDDRGQ